ncbi:MAG: hypothetical protein R3A51_23030 [Nannocystaceae bacterium]|nr:hypothetical protein [Myxococcales bacterium]
MSVLDLRVLASAALALALVACTGDKGAPGEPRTPAEKGAAAGQQSPDAAPVAQADPGGDKVKTIPGKDPADDRFTLNIEPPADVKAGAEGLVKVTVLPKAPWHMNLDFPTSLKVEPPKGVTVTKSEQHKEDAVKLDENSAEFGVAFTATEPGEKTFVGKFNFAVCQEEACAPVSEDVEFRVAVK